MPSEGTRTALWLGYGGLIPFVGLSLAAVVGLEPAGWSAQALLLGYAATILSFLGAIHWGMAVALPDPNAPRDFVASVVPPLVAWVALAMTPTAGLWIFVGAFPVWYAWERRSMLARYPAWFRKLRAVLTTVVTVSLATTAVLT